MDTIGGNGRNTGRLGLRAIRHVPKMPSAGISCHEQLQRTLIGKREIVGFGFNGEPSYVDRADFPMPAIRWKEPTSDVQALREKEKGDWKNLSVEEKRLCIEPPSVKLLLNSKHLQENGSH
ncbi:unnamed protein product [Callosobruchus maculatus]|uniref:Cytochrome c oxidase subunit 4 n=1 Tax=Callosobruchus maculatus TaxID=64391 RepID=A0A653DD97_CALMS|nr:unnamed protein product [Callosobruchus maculatus]